MRLWLKSPIAILAEDAAGGIVIETAVISELSGAGKQPAMPVDEVCDASRHVVLPARNFAIKEQNP